MSSRHGTSDNDRMPIISSESEESDDSDDPDSTIDNSFFLSSPKISSLHYQKLVADVNKQLGKENANLKKERVDLHYKIDLLTAKILDQEQKIGYLFDKLGYPQLQSPAKQNPAPNAHTVKEGAPAPGKNLKHAVAVDEHAPPQKAVKKRASSENQTSHTDASTEAAPTSPVTDSTRRPWSNICKNYNRGSC